MTAKLNILAAAPDVMKAWTGASLAIAASLEPSLIELVKIRASQINGCANCINMHTAEARAKGETEQRIYLLSAWREAPVLHRPRARRARLDRGADAALRRTRPTRAPTKRCKAQFTEEEQVKLTLMINVINGWNRSRSASACWSIRRRKGRGARRPPDGRRRPRGRGGELRSAASEAHARRLPHARLGRRRRGRGAGGLHPLDGGRPRARCASPRRSCAARSRGSASISSNRRGASARPMSAPGFPSRSSKRRKRKTSPCR